MIGKRVMTVADQQLDHTFLRTRLRLKVIEVSTGEVGSTIEGKIRAEVCRVLLEDTDELYYVVAWNGVLGYHEPGVGACRQAATMS